MAVQSPFKSYQRGRRTASIETEFNSGMYFTSGAVEEGYMKTLVNLDLASDKRSLSSRPGLRVNELCSSSSMSLDISEFLSDQFQIFAAKDCIEDGHNYRQFIVGDPTRPDLWIVTVDKENMEKYIVTPENRLVIDSRDISDVFELSKDFIEEYDANTEDYEAAPTFEDFEFVTSEWTPWVGETLNDQVLSYCSYNNVKLDNVHDLPIKDNAVHSSIVGCFGFNNSYYFITRSYLDPSVVISNTYFDSVTGYYKYHVVEPKEVNAAEAVTYGYNMLSEDPYVFADASGGSSNFQMLGILPYDAKAEDDGKLMMTPRKNQDVWFRCYYDVPSLSDKYFIQFEWKELTSDEWINIWSDDVEFTDLPVLEVPFKPPSEDIMIRVSAYAYVNNVLQDYVEAAMTVGFDFSVDEHGTVSNLEQKNYDLKTAKGMVYWKNRLVLYGVPEDPTIIFISDLNEPSYFPYPNNITVLDQPVISVLEFMGNLVVFTTDKIYQITLSEDGTSWNTDVIQANLRISPVDQHMILTVRNMLFFKSGDYYYMVVPKSTSTTGELTIAPISTPVVELFKNFSNNISEIFRYVYGVDEDYELIDFYNFLDYEDVHNVYVFEVDDCDGYVHVDVIYNTMDRIWRIYVYQTVHKIFPYQYEASKSGVFATTNVYEESPGVFGRCFQFFEFDSKNAKDFYIPADWIQDIIDEPVEKLRELVLSDEEQYKFKNYQYFDTGYRNDAIHTNKRYREVQFQINNIDLEELEFGLEFRIDGDNRITFFRYDTDQVVDTDSEDYGYVYIEPVPIMNVPIDFLNTIPDELDFKMNHWKLGASRFPEVNLWKVRIPVSGKGMAPRMKLLSCNESRLNFFSLNWVYRVMYMR